MCELNVRKPTSETISIDTIGGVLNVSDQMLDSNLISVNDMLQDVGILIGRSIEPLRYHIGHLRRIIKNLFPLREFPIYQTYHESHQAHFSNHRSNPHRGEYRWSPFAYPLRKDPVPIPDFLSD